MLTWKGKSTIKCWKDFFGMPPLYKHTVKTSSSGHFDIRKLYLISFEECVFFCKKKVATKYYNHLVISSVNAMKPATKGHMSDNLW